jgi:hypothetical protein
MIRPDLTWSREAEAGDHLSPLPYRLAALTRRQAEAHRRDRARTLTQLQLLIRTSRLRFALLTDRRPLIEFYYVVQLSWLRDHRNPVQPSDYGGPRHSLLGQQFYSCDQAAGSVGGSPAG